MPAKKTHEEFVNEMKSIAPDIMIIGKYNGRHESIEVMCRNCGKRWSPTAGDLLSGKGCRQCRIKKFSDSRKKTNEDFVSELYLLNPNVRPLEQYVNSHTKIKTQCLICGNIWMITPKDLLHGYGCRKCYIKKSSENRRYTSEEYFKKASALNPGVDISGSFKGLTEKITAKCNVCGFNWNPKASALIYRPGCPNCRKTNALIKRRKSQEQFEREVSEVLPDVQILGKYRTSTEPIECKCNVCGYTWDAIPQSLLYGHGCKRCSRSGTSFMEQFILHAFMSALGEARVVSRDKTAIGMELDIYVPFMSFAIEPGTWAFHKNAVERDKTKREECRKKGIRLITVYDSYPKNKRPPFQEDCIVFNYDYNTADHSYIRDLVVRLFELTGLSNTFTETKWNEIEQLAYRDARAKNTEEFINEITTIRSDIEILGTYVGSKIPITTKCKKCGKIWNARPANLLHGSNCPSCSKEQNTKRQTKSHEQFVEEVNEKQPQITILGKYIKGKAHVRAKCNVCGTVWDPVAASLLNGEGCPVCGAKKKGKGRRKTQKQYKEELFEANPNIELLSEYEGTTSPVRVRCKICGYEWTITARKLIYNPHHKSEYKMHAIMEQSSLE